MKKIFITLTLFLAAPVFAAVELDTDRNGATDISRGGTNSTTTSGAKANLGIPSTLSALTDDTTHRVVTDAQIGAWDSKQAALTAGTDYLTPNGSAAGLVNFPASLATDSEVSAAVAGKEPTLGNPTTSGWCLQSTDGGVRSWGVCGGLADATADSQTYGRLNGVWVPVVNATDLVDFSALSPLSFNPSTGALSMVAHAYQAYDANMIVWPVAVSATEVSHLDGATSNLQTQINAISAGGFVPTYVTADPTTASTVGLYVNTTSGHMFVVGAPGMLDVAGTWTAKPSAETWTILDDFSSDTRSNYTRIEGETTLTLDSGKVRDSAITGSAWIHNADLGSDAQEVIAEVTDTDGSDSHSNIIVRQNSSTGARHTCYVDDHRTNLACYGTAPATTINFPPFVGGTWLSGEKKMIRITVNAADLYSAYVNWNGDGETWVAEGTSTNASAAGGTRVGIQFYYGDTTTTIDNFKARVLP